MSFLSSASSFAFSSCLSSPSFCPFSSFLSSEPAAEEPVTPEDDGKSSAAAPQDDILSSPAFLKKKLEVLKEDITTCDLQIDAAKALFDVNKAEFGEKIDQLNLEVCLETNKVLFSPLYVLLYA